MIFYLKQLKIYSLRIKIPYYFQVDGLTIKVPYSFQKKQRLKNRFRLEKNNNITNKLINEVSNVTPVEENSEKHKSSNENIPQKTNESKKLKEGNFLQGFVKKQTKNKVPLKTQLQSIEKLTSLPKMKMRKRLSSSVVPAPTSTFKVERPHTQLNIRHPNVVQIGDEACKVTYARINRNSSGSFARKISNEKLNLVKSAVSGEKVNDSSQTKLNIDSYFANKNSNRGENFLHNYLFNKKTASSYDFTSPAISKHAGTKNSKNMYPMPKLSLNTYKVQQKQNLIGSASRKNSFSNQTYNNFVERNNREKVSYQNDNLTRLKTPKLPKATRVNTSTVVYKYQKKLDKINRSDRTSIYPSENEMLLSKRLRTPATMRVLSKKYKDKYRLQLSSLHQNFA